MKHLMIRALANIRKFYYSSKCFIVSIFVKADENYILFDSFGGIAFNDNPKAVFENYLTSDKQLVWAFKKKDLIKQVNDCYPNVITVKFFSFKHFYYLCKCKYWVFNYKTPPYFIKNKDTVYLQTWHGIPLKKLGCDIEDKNQKFYRSQQSYQQMAQAYIDEGRKCDYFITPSIYAKDKLSSAFKLDNEKALEVGYPRNEKLYKYKDDSNFINKIRAELNLTKKVILYAPTWRDDNSSLISGYKTDALLNFDLMYEYLKDEYQVIYKPHYLINEKKDLSKYKDFIIDCSNSNELDKLMLISDLLITDYSSIYFDYSILERDIYFVMLDLVNYKDNLRGFYIDIDNDLPNDYYEDEKKLYEAIKNNITNTTKYDSFIKANKNFELDYSKIHKIIK